MTHYIDHVQDGPWFESLVARHGVEAILQECVGVLGNRNPQEVHEVTTFLRDIGIHGIVRKELSTKIRELIPGGVLPALRSLLRAPILDLRMAALYTLGKLGFPSEAKTLREVFPAYLDRDPICLELLLGELSWLGDRRGVHARLKRVIAHENPLVRWSALGYLSASASGRERRLTSQWLYTLSSDPAPRVAAEASHQLAMLESKAAENDPGPAITFSILAVRFRTERGRTGQADYTLKELAAFVDA